MAAEHAGARHRGGFVARQRYRPRQWDNVADWRCYAASEGPAADGARWFGFAAVRDLDGLPPEILMVPLPGHTAGHAGVAVRSDRGWLLHAGDAYLHRDQLAGRRGPPGLAIYQAIMDTDRSARTLNQMRLRELARHHAEVTVFCAHDTQEFAALRRSVAPAAARARRDG
jgi:glyoxylase-like metal-dependent hydrolase (beta-lactamase superfamily II)